jgi:ribosomal protein S1
MKKAIAIILAVLFVFAVTSISFAAEKKAAVAPAEKKAEPMPAEKPKVKHVTGEVKAVDTAAMTITVTKTVKAKVVETVVTVNDKTKIMMGAEKKTLADVKVGDKVKAKYIETDGKNVAKSVVIMPAAAAEKKAEVKKVKKVKNMAPAENK